MVQDDEVELRPDVYEWMNSTQAEIKAIAAVARTIKDELTTLGINVAMAEIGAQEWFMKQLYIATGIKDANSPTDE